MTILTGFGIIAETKNTANIPEVIRYHKGIRFIEYAQYTAICIESTVSEYEGSIVSCSIPSHPLNTYIKHMEEISAFVVDPTYPNMIIMSGNKVKDSDIMSEEAKQETENEESNKESGSVIGNKNDKSTNNSSSNKSSRKTS